MRRLPRFVVALAAVTPVVAQDLEPRAFSNSPVGMQFFIAGYGQSRGDVNLDPALPIDNLGVETDFGLVAWARTLGIAGKSAKIDVVVPYSSLDAHGLVLDQPRFRHVSGFGDPAVRFSMNFIGAPALTLEEFAGYKQDLIVGGSLRLGIPLGQYDEDRLINIGSNRWSLRPELGISKAAGPWTLELTPGISLYSDNDDFFGGQTREQDPIWSMQSHLSYTFTPGCWLAFDASYFDGGRTTVNALPNNDRQEGFRFGLTFAVPVTRHQSVKLYALQGYDTSMERDLNVFGLAWQYRWGGGY
jgi:hypothetical protein